MSPMFAVPLAAAALALPTPADPAPPHPAPTPLAAAPPVEALVAEALDRNPSIAALRARLGAAREMVAPAGALPDPMVELMLTDVDFPRWTVGEDEMSMLGVEVRQSFPWAGNRGARRDVAQADAALREAELERTRREVARQVRVAYGELYMLDRELALLPAGREMLELLEQTTAARYGANGATQEALVKARLLKVRLSEQEADLLQRREVLVAMLGRLLDRTDAFALGPVAALPEPPAPPADMEALAVEHSAEVRARQAGVIAAERRVVSAERDLRPGFSAGALVASRGAYDPVVTLRFGIELPVWRRTKQLPMVRAAELERDMARAEVREAEAMARAAARELLSHWHHADQQVRRYREGIVPLAQEALAAARTDYLAGRGDFSMVIEDFNEWLEARVGLARREADLFHSWAEHAALLRPEEGR